MASATQLPRYPHPGCRAQRLHGEITDGAGRSERWRHGCGGRSMARSHGGACRDGSGHWRGGRVDRRFSLRQAQGSRAAGLSGRLPAASRTPRADGWSCGRLGCHRAWRRWSSSLAPTRCRGSPPLSVDHAAACHRRRWGSLRHGTTNGKVPTRAVGRVSLSRCRGRMQEEKVNRSTLEVVAIEAFETVRAHNGQV